MKPESGVPGSFQVLGIKYLSSKEPAGEDLPLVNLPAFKEIPAVGLFAIAVVSEDCGNTPSFHRALSNAKVPLDGSFVFIDGFSEEGTAALKPFIGGPTVPSVLVFGNGKLIDYVESGLSADNIKHLLYRNNFVKADPGLNRRWKKEIDRKDIVRSLSWNINLSGTDLSDLDLRGAFFSALFFSGADFSNSDLRDANFNGARLNYASFKGANLKGATFEGAIWGETICPNGTLSDDSKNGTCFP